MKTYPISNKVSNYAIPYIIAKSCADKKDNFTITSVCWQEAPMSTKIIYFKSITSKTVVVLPPSLPLGYQMEWHPTWTELFEHICDRAKIESASFVGLDSIQQDYELLIETLNLDRIDNPIYDFRKDYLEYRSEIDESWYELRNNISDGIGSLFINCWQASEINNIAPPINEALQKMFPQLSHNAISLMASELTKHTTLQNDYGN